MPDSLALHDFGAALRPTPSAHPASRIEAARRVTGNTYRDQRLSLVAALSPLIGYYTVADAVQLLAAIRMRTNCRSSLDSNGNQCIDFDTLVSIGIVLEE